MIKSLNPVIVDSFAKNFHCKFSQKKIFFFKEWSAVLVGVRFRNTKGFLGTVNVDSSFAVFMYSSKSFLIAYF